MEKNKRLIVSRKREPIEIDLTPMIDCVMNLVIFMMCISAVTTIIGFTIKIPPPSLEPLQAELEEDLEVFIYQDRISTGHKILQEGVIKLNGRPVYLEDFVNRLKLERRKINKKYLIIKGEPFVYHDKIVKIMDLAQEAEIKSFTLVPVEEEE